MRKLFMKVITNTPQEPKRKPPLLLDLDSDFVYQTGANVQAIWRKYGWVPPTDTRNDYEFKKNREMGVTKCS